MQLVAYCDFDTMLTYRLDLESALVLVSAVEVPASDKASEDKCVTATVEHMVKVSRDDIRSLHLAMTLEWKSVLSVTTEDPSGQKPVRSSAAAYWDVPVAKLRRLASEPTSPTL